MVSLESWDHIVTGATWITLVFNLRWETSLLKVMILLPHIPNEIGFWSDVSRCEWYRKPTKLMLARKLHDLSFPMILLSAMFIVSCGRKCKKKFDLHLCGYLPRKTHESKKKLEEVSDSRDQLLPKNIKMIPLVNPS